MATCTKDDILIIEKLLFFFGLVLALTRQAQHHPWVLQTRQLLDNQPQDRLDAVTGATVGKLITGKLNQMFTSSIP